MRSGARRRKRRSIAFRRALEHELAGQTVSQPGIYAAVIAMVLAVALAACAIPALRAGRISAAGALSEP